MAVTFTIETTAPKPTRIKNLHKQLINAGHMLCVYYENTEDSLDGNEKIERLFKTLDTVGEADRLMEALISRDTGAFDVERIAYLLWVNPRTMCGTWSAATALQWYRRARTNLLKEDWKKVHGETFAQGWRIGRCIKVYISDMLALKNLALNGWDFTITAIDD